MIGLALAAFWVRTSVKPIRPWTLEEREKFADFVMNVPRQSPSLSERMIRRRYANG